MRTLTHFPLCPYSRKIRLAMAEKKLDVELVVEPYWEKRADYLAMNPSGEVPTLTVDGMHLADSVAISEYLEECFPEMPLMPSDSFGKAEVRRLMGWFDRKFYWEVTDNLLGEKVLKRLAGGNTEPDSKRIRLGFKAIHKHLEYLGYLTERRSYLAGSNFTLADITAAAHLSVIDYMGDVPWDQHPAAKDWYVRIKSRPTFRSLLTDHINGFPPPKHYADLDF